MEHHINQIIAQFQEKLQHITATNPDELIKANKGIKLCQATLSKLKRVITTHSFEDMTAEIHFFKQIKHLPMSYLLYYKKVCSCETYVPKIGYKSKRKYLEENMEMVNTFFSVNAVFVNYIRLQCSNMDECYFTRNFMDDDSSIETSDIYYDPDFNTMYDILLAKVKANYMYMEYLNRKLAQLYDTNKEGPGKVKSKRRLVYKGKVTNMVKLMMALRATKFFENDPNLNIMKDVFEEAFNMKFSNVYGTQKDIINSDNPADFLEELLYSFLKMLKDRDDIKPK